MTVARDQVGETVAGTVWKRLNALDFVGHAMGLAALLLLTLFPFLIVMSALADRSAATELSTRIGLNQQAAAAMNHLFNSSASTSNAITAGGLIALIAGVVAVAGALQALYERIFGLPRRGMRDVHRFLVWIAVTCVLATGMAYAGRTVRNSGAGPVVLGALSLFVLILFFWWSMHFLMGARVGWRPLLPCAVATSVCWIGLGVFSSFYFSRTVISNNKTYGSIGVVFALMSWLIAVSVVLILGAVICLVWNEWRRERRITGVR